MKTFLLPWHHSTLPQAPRHLAIVFAALIALTLATPGLRAATDVLFADNFQPVQAEGWNGMSWDFGAATGVVPTTQFPSGNYSYLLYAYGGGAAGWAVYNTPVLAGLSEWSYQAKAKYDQSLFSGTPQPGYSGSGGLLISATGDMSGDYIWVGLNCDFGEVSPGVTFARPILEYRLGGETGSRVLYPPEVDSWGAIRMSKGNALGPATLTASRTAGSPGTITLVIDSPTDGQRVATINFTGAAAAALDNLAYVGFVNYFSQWEYDDVSVSGGGGEIYANDFESGGQPGWYTMGNAFWWVRGGPGGTNGNFTFRDQAINDGYAFYTAPVLTNTSTNWSYSGQAKWTDSTGVAPYYGVGGLVLSSDQYGSDYLWVGYTRGDYGDPNSPGSAWCYAFYDYRLDGVTGSGNFTAQGAFRDFPDSPPVGITLSREPGSNELTFVVETPLDGVQTNTITVATNAAAALDSLQYVGLRNYFGAFQYGNLQVTTTNFVPPTITSTNAFSGTVGAAFGNNITATGDEPIVYSGAGLPAGLTVATNGLISGTPTAAGTFSNVVFTAAGASFSQNFESYAAGSYPFPSNPLPGWAALPSAYGMTPSIVTNTAGNGKALEMPSAGGGATGWMLVSSNVLAGPSDEWQVSATSKWTATFNPSIPYYGSGGVLVSDTLPTETLTGNWLQIGYARREYGDTNDPTRSWSLPILEGNLGGSAVSVPLGGPAFRDFPEHAPIGLTVTRRAGTITLTISTPLDGTMVRSHTFTGAQAAALDTLQYAGFANYFSEWEYDNLQVANATALDSQTVTFTIAKGTPTITLAPTASAITAGQALSASLLTGGTASIPGTFDWTTPSTVPPSTGLYGVTFSPTDAANYNTAMTDVSVTVNSSSAYNTWAGGYGLDPAVSSGPTAGAPTADPDGDTFNNAAEYAFGTNPTVGNGALLRTSTSGGNILTSWLEVSGGGVTYAIEETSNLSAGPWTLSSVIPAATGAPAPAGYAWKQISVPAGPGRKFYRVVASY